MAGYRLELDWTCHDYAETLLLASPVLDHQEQALSLAAEGMTLARELGMTPVLEGLVHLSENIQFQGVTPIYPVNLTEREVEVLRLMAAGKTNRQISTALFISPHPVNCHVTNIFFKTATINRASASDRFVQQTL